MATSQDRRLARQAKYEAEHPQPIRVRRRGLRPQSWRGKLAKPKYGLSTSFSYVSKEFSHAYTPKEWSRRKKARKLARQRRIRNAA